MPVDTIIVMIGIVISVSFCGAALAWAKPADNR
jgi:hypothetical protein